MNMDANMNTKVKSIDLFLILDLSFNSEHEHYCKQRSAAIHKQGQKHRYI